MFDYCQNLDFFSQDPATTDGASGASLSKRLFKARLELIGELDSKLEAAGENLAVDGSPDGEPKTEATLRHSIAQLLQVEVATMNVDNFVVRPYRRAVEKHANPEAWTTLSIEAYTELAGDVAGLPTELEAEGEEAKRFDLLIMNLQLAVLKAEPSFERLCKQVKSIADLLEEKSAIPMVQDQMPLIQDLQTDEWWQDVTTPMLESVRRRLRLLVRLIDKHKRTPIYTDFEDEMGEATEVTLPGFAPADQWEKFRAKTQAFLLANQQNVTVLKLRTNQALTIEDLEDLERLLIESGIGGEEEITRAKSESQGLGLFVRSLVGLDREAAKEAIAVFLSGKTLDGNQIEFVNMVVNHLTQYGMMDASLLYESPFTDLSSGGPEDRGHQ